jgi:regulator of sigma E protease
MNMLLGLLILSVVVFLHELGHFLAAKALGVPAPFFSVGIGPVLFKWTWGQTEYRISALPLGGYVLFGRGENFDATGSLERIIIYAAGPLANFLTALAIYGGDFALLVGQTEGVLGIVGKLFTGQIGVNQLAGPLGIMEVAGTHAAQGLTQVLGFVAFLSINLAVLNLLPLPVLDGGQILIASIEGIARRRIHTGVRVAVALVCWALLLFLIAQVTIGDIGRMTRGPAALRPDPALGAG